MAGQLLARASGAFQEVYQGLGGWLRGARVVALKAPLGPRERHAGELLVAAAVGEQTRQLVVGPVAAVARLGELSEAVERLAQSPSNEVRQRDESGRLFAACAAFAVGGCG